MKKRKIAIFGHYGNCNLGDEAIIEAAIQNLRQRVENCEIVGLSINPFDTKTRHNIESFPIRYRSDFFTYGPDYIPSPKKNLQQEKPSQDASSPKGIKQKIKSIPVLGSILKSAALVIDKAQALIAEIGFLVNIRKYTKDIDLLLITGSNQLLDNYGGPWGFPYTLFKWTLLAKNTNTKVGFISVGAGPLTLPLSFKMLGIALNKADYVSYRDEGSKTLVESKIKINAPVYPDIAHSLHMAPSSKKSHKQLSIAINPMPVYDSRYWYLADQEKYLNYINKIEQLCIEILNKGDVLHLFSTQPADSNVIIDILEDLKSHLQYDDWKERINIRNPEQVSDLVNLLNEADIIVATRFHATLLPLQLKKPVIGICYYRKAAELLDEMGLEDFHVDVDNFEAEDLKKMLHSIINIQQQVSDNINIKYGTYKTALNEQYEKIVSLLT